MPDGPAPLDHTHARSANVRVPGRARNAVRVARRGNCAFRRPSHGELCTQPWLARSGRSSRQSDRDVARAGGEPRSDPVADARLSRRDFPRISGAGAGRAFVGSVAGVPFRIPVADGQIPGGTLDPLGASKFVTPLLVPPVMPKAGTIRNRGGKNTDYYEISVEQFSQQILPAGLPATTVWGYGPVGPPGRKGVYVHNAPSLTIEASWNTPVRVKWVNDLVRPNGTFRSHLLAVDPTLHWANPPGGTTGRDTRPAFPSTPGPYTGPVPFVTHVHGAAGVGDESDGYAEAWYLPAVNDIPDGYATEGTWYTFFAAKAAAKNGAIWGPGFASFDYRNTNRASTLWYHDHTLGMTRLNVYAGPAGFYLLRGGPAGDDAVVDSRTGARGVLLGPAPKENDPFPSKKRYYEIPLAMALATIDRLLTGDASRSGPVRTSYVRWDRVHPAVRASDPGRHQPWELLGTLNIDFHISTPWYCTDVDGTLTYYLFFFLDGSGRLRVNADGWSFRYDGGGPFCTGEVSSRLRDAASGAVGTVESQIRTAFDLLTGSSRFSMLYFLPGRGSRSGSASGNADDTVALAVLPR